MLFDLQGKRRRGIQAIYALLAFIMVGGLVFFGIGGAVSGGLVDAVQSGGDSTFRDDVKRLERRRERSPDDPRLLASLIEARYQLAVSSSSAEGFTAEGKRELERVVPAWERYARVEDAPDEGVLSLMLQVFGTDGLDRPEDAVDIADALTREEPSAQSFYQLSYFATLAKQTRKASLAKRAALDAAKDRDERRSLRDAFEQIEAQSAQTGEAPAAGSPPIAP